MPVETHIYTNRFFKNTIKLEADSSSSFVDIVLEYFSPQSIVDIGCGAGIYLSEFEKRGIKDCFGIDGSPSAREEFLPDKSKLEIFDLASRYDFKRRYDLCLCLEVAEHLREDDADTLLDTITSSSDTIIFTAATPGQASRRIGHINEQPHDYWIDKFSRKEYLFLEDMTKEMRAKMKAGNVVWWIVNNLMIFERRRIDLKSK